MSVATAHARHYLPYTPYFVCRSGEDRGNSVLGKSSPTICRNLPGPSLYYRRSFGESYQCIENRGL